MPSAQVTIRGTPLKALSDSHGSFRIPGVGSGQVTLDVHAVGFVAQEFHLSLESGIDRRVSLMMPRIAQTLPDVAVLGIGDKPARYANTTKYDEFFLRKALGIGTFITREDIDRQFKASTQELLQTIPGILIRQTGTQWWVQFLRCGPAKVPGRETVKRESEPVEVFVDGQFSPDGTDRLEMINPAEIEAVEIYKGPSELPAIARGKGCGAIFIWLRQGR